MYWLAATPLSPLLLVLAIPIGIGIALIGSECAAMWRHLHWPGSHHPMP